MVGNPKICHISRVRPQTIGGHDQKLLCVWDSHIANHCLITSREGGQVSMCPLSQLQEL